MKKSILLALIGGAMVGLIPVLGANALSLSPELQKLDVSVGHWVFTGRTLRAKTGKPGAFTWNEDCRWSSNQLYLECTFSNVWAGKAVESLVVDTYNSADRSYWHYELFGSGEPGAHPFVSRMADRVRKEGDPRQTGRRAHRLPLGNARPRSCRDRELEGRCALDRHGSGGRGKEVKPRDLQSR